MYVLINKVCFRATDSMLVQIDLMLCLSCIAFISQLKHLMIGLAIVVDLLHFLSTFFSEMVPYTYTI